MIAGVELTQEGERRVVVVTMDSGKEHAMDVEAIASWGEILGLTDVIDTIEAIVMVRENGEPDPDPVTGENAFTAPLTALGHRERAREAEAWKAIAEGTQDDPRSPRLRGALAARNSMMEPIGATTESESLLEKTRAGSRGVLGTGCPQKVRITGRSGDPTCEVAPQTTAGSPSLFTEACRTKVHEAITGITNDVGQMKAKVLHGLSGNDDDPLADDGSPVLGGSSFEELVRRHSGES